MHVEHKAEASLQGQAWCVCMLVGMQAWNAFNSCPLVGLGWAVQQPDAQPAGATLPQACQPGTFGS